MSLEGGQDLKPFQIDNNNNNNNNIYNNNGLEHNYGSKQ